MNYGKTTVQESPDLSAIESPAMPIQEVPQTLEVHPSIPDHIASGLMEVSRRLLSSPELYNQDKDHFSNDDPTGCILCHLKEVLTVNGEAPWDDTFFYCRKHPMFEKLFWYQLWPEPFKTSFLSIVGENDEGYSYATQKRFRDSRLAPIAISRIEHFLRTGE